MWYDHILMSISQISNTCKFNYKLKKKENVKGYYTEIRVNNNKRAWGGVEAHVLVILLCIF